MAEARANVVSSFTTKGSLIHETLAAFSAWDLTQSNDWNFARLKAQNTISASSANWLRDVAKILHRRFDPAGRDRPLVELAQAGIDPETWKPILLWHMTRDEFLVRDFLVNWLYPRYVEGVFRLTAADVVPYLDGLAARKDIRLSGTWSQTTTRRIASGLLRIAADFGLLTGVVTRHFASYHLPESAFLYLLHALAEKKPNAEHLVRSPDWRMYLMDAADVERELLRLHQYRRLRYEVAGSLAQLDLPCPSLALFAREMAR